MNTVVGKLLDVDRRARQLLDDAKQYYEKTIEELDREKEAIREKYAEKAAAHIADVRHAETAAVEEAVAKITADSAEKTRRLNETFEKNHAAWENELFERCVRQVTPGA